MLSVASHHAKQSRVSIHPTKTKAVILNKTKNMSRNDLSWSLGDNLIYPSNETIHFGLRNRPVNLQRGGYGFLFRSKIFFRTTRELEYYFFLSLKARFSSLQHLTLSYLTKNLNQIIFFSSTKIRIFFSATLGIRISFLEKNHIPSSSYLIVP
jgi:hypothetical protein